MPQSGVVHGFGTILSGNGRYLNPIKEYLNNHQINFKSIVDPNQYHSDVVRIVTKSDSDTAVQTPRCDGIITNQKSIILTVVTADCVPIIFSDPVAGVVGISHQGWKGTDLKLAKKVIEKFIELGCRTDDLYVAIGPSIGACCYPRNLLKENYDQLISVGVLPKHIDYFPFCTKCDEARFYSYRRSTIKKGFPEQFSFVMINN